MGLLVVGSIGLDTVETPVDRVVDALGGSATFISLAASYFDCTVQLVGVVGDDFPPSFIELLKKHKIDLEGIQIKKGEKTFRWGGRYHHDPNLRDTLFTDLNAFEKFNPVIPERFRSSEFICLGNIDPILQMRVLEQIKNPKFIVCDTMNLWIKLMKDDLLKLIKKVNAFIINDSEARQLTDEPNLIKAAKQILKLGPEILIIKKGEHGAMLFAEDKIFSAPAYPMETIYDPTGAGDAFAGGLIGYLHQSGKLNFASLKKAVIYGSTMASFCVERFSTKGLEVLSSLQIQDRFNEFRKISRFDETD